MWPPENPANGAKARTRGRGVCAQGRRRATGRLARRHSGPQRLLAPSPPPHPHAHYTHYTKSGEKTLNHALNHRKPDSRQPLLHATLAAQGTRMRAVCGVAAFTAAARRHSPVEMRSPAPPDGFFRRRRPLPPPYSPSLMVQASFSPEKESFGGEDFLPEWEHKLRIVVKLPGRRRLEVCPLCCAGVSVLRRFGGIYRCYIGCSKGEFKGQSRECCLSGRSWKNKRGTATSWRDG